MELGSGWSGSGYPSWVFICYVTLSRGALLSGQLVSHGWWRGGSEVFSQETSWT